MYIPSLKLTYTEHQKERIVFQPRFSRGRALSFREGKEHKTCALSILDEDEGMKVEYFLPRNFDACPQQSLLNCLASSETHGLKLNMYMEKDIVRLVVYTPSDGFDIVEKEFMKT